MKSRASTTKSSNSPADRRERKEPKTSAVFPSSSSNQQYISCFYHFVCCMLYSFILFYDILCTKDNKELIKLLKIDAFGGRFKFLTFLTLCILTFYYIVAFLTDVVPLLRSRCQSFVDWLFTTIVFPISLIVGIFFWSIYAIDRNLIYPEFMDKHIPSHLNHLLHTVLLFVVMLEVLLVKHKHPSTFVSVATMLAFSATYTAWICLVYYMSGHWVYPFMRYFSTFTFSLFIGASTGVSVFFYYIGKNLSWLRHG